MKTILNKLDKVNFIEELEKYTSVDVVDMISKGKPYHHMEYYCVLDGIMEIVSAKINIADIMGGYYKDSKCRGILSKTYEDSYKRIPNFAPLVKGNILARKLFNKVDGESFDKGLEYLKKHIKEFHGCPRVQREPHPFFSNMFVGCGNPQIRRYTDNTNKKTFDLIDVMVITKMTCARNLKNWYLESDENKKLLIDYTLDMIKTNRAYKKYDVPVDYLKLAHVGVGNGKFLLTFELK